MAKKTYRAIGRVQGVSTEPLNHGDTVELEHDHEHTVALVAAGALKLASAEETADEHAGDLGYSVSQGSEKGTTLGDAVQDKKEPKAPKTVKPKAKSVKSSKGKK